MEQNSEREIEMYQTIVLTMADGRVLTFTGPAGIKDGELMRKIQVTPPQSMAPGCSWGPMED